MPNDRNDPLSVAVVGGGIAGLTAALRLAERGYAVTIYESKDVLGGNLSSKRINGTYHDVYPHMFCEWYTNFWEIFEKDLGLQREQHFEPRSSVKMLPDGSDKYVDLKNSNELGALLHNVFSGIKPPADMFLYGYAAIDLASHRFDPRNLLQRNTIAGFLYAQYYTSERSAELFDLVLREIWSIDGSHTSVNAYQKFAQHTQSPGRAMPFAWLLKGNLQQRLIDPLERELIKRKCTIHKSAAVSQVRVHTKSKGGAIELLFDGAGPQPNRRGRKPSVATFDHVIMAVPPDVLAKLVRSGRRGQRIEDKVPDTSELRTLRAVPIPVVDVYFKEKLPDLPREHVTVSGARNLDLTFLDISQLWDTDPKMRDRTALVLAASNFYGLLSEKDEEAGFEIIRAFHEHLPCFQLGTKWGSSPDIDWDKTRVLMNLDHTLYVNEVGDSVKSPVATYPALPNVFFAGDYCQNVVAMACVEGAVLTGLQAAAALWERAPRGERIEIKSPPEPSQSTLLALKLALTPAAYLAKAWSLATDAAPDAAKGNVEGVTKAAAKILQLPSAYMLEVMNTGFNFVDSLLSKRGSK